MCTIALFVFIAFIVFTKTVLFLDDDPNRFIVTEGLEYGWYPQETEFDSHLIAIGLQYKAEYQSLMSEQFTLVNSQVADIQMFMR